ncbi:general transcription factor IIH subunit 2 isoform X3 [Pogonomyrmex barbatus]|uniref:General transcription factor IIH subunit 2 isoform X3 n=1 Tax=Pogonomyrmex barbatus TaxID=144034 RepID=A0A6I9W0V8_9HYME|nr:general transcription factor IIH subunit 2 isoform X3 [Pogonomyrmex barbatus]
MAEEESEEKEYRWETGYEKTWEAIKEDDHGLLEASVADIIHNAKRKRQLERKQGARLGMMRHLYIILDASESMLNQDLKPTRFLCSLKELQTLQQTMVGGEPSLQNSLELATKLLKLLPSHASKEILVIIGALTTCDPGDINETIRNMKLDSIRCSVIGLAAELYICKRMANTTGGEHSVALDDKHYKEQLNAHIDPPPAAKRLDAALVKMGFPHHALHSSAPDTSITVCMCHAQNSEESIKLMTTGYLCPQCLSKHCELPVECRACGLTLVSAPHLARSYHYLFPVDPFKEVALESNFSFCFGCQKAFVQKDKKVYICGKCNQTFCLDCEIFIHEILHTCPGCAVNPESYKKSADKS